MTKTEDVELYNTLVNEPVLRKPLVTDAMFKLLEKSLDEYNQREWPNELKMYYRLYGNLVFKVPHYLKRLQEIEKSKWDSIFITTEAKSSSTGTVKIHATN